MFVLLRFIASIFYQILYMSILGSVIGLVILLIQKIINRKISPKCNYFIWLVFIFILIFPISFPSKISVYNLIEINGIRFVKNEYISDVWKSFSDFKQKQSTQIKPVTSYNNTNLFGIDFKITVANLLLMISFTKIFISIYSYSKLIKKFGNEQVKDKRILDIVDNCKRELNIRRNIKIINQNIANSPAIIGICDVKILYTETLNSLDDADLKNMFLHELSHYKRRDNYMNFVIMILEALYWFNPIVKYMFKYIKREMEFATDELAIKNMNVEETRAYCKTIIDAEERMSTKFVPALGFAGELEYVDKRIDFISLRTNFKKFSKIISFITIFIVLLICLIFYPTSYGATNIPKLYLQTEDGILTEINNTENSNKTILNSVELDKNSSVKIIIKDAGKNNYIYFHKTNLGNNYTQERKTTILNDKIICFEEGEFLYNFTIINRNKRTFDYIIKVIVK